MPQRLVSTKPRRFQMTKQLTLAAGALLAATLALPAMAQTGQPSGSTDNSPAQGKGEEHADASKHVDRALQTVQTMEKDAQLKKLMQQAKGIFIVPDYGRAALGVGAQGGAGVLLAHLNNKWTGPGFYNFGGISVGPQAGVTAGSVALLLMNDKALNRFNSNNNFSLNADAGITVASYSARATGTAAKGDVIMWSGEKGAMVEMHIGVTDINFDEKETASYYGREVTPKQIVSGQANSPKAAKLTQALPK
jgi:lipid-binding SYLF domain-containing protein